MQPFVKTIHARGVLSFAPDSEPLPLTPLNVLIGPNGSGKSNLIEIFELLKALPTDLAEVIREGGGIGEWLWKGEGTSINGAVSAELRIPRIDLLRYRLVFGLWGQRLQVLDEVIENADSGRAEGGDAFYYRFQDGSPKFRSRQENISAADYSAEVSLKPHSLDPAQSVLSQRKDPDQYPEVTAIGYRFADILTFREWSFGRLPEPRLDPECH
jgi:predicted ATPase